MKTLKEYPAYKDSGVEWLGDVPEQWTVKRLKTVLSRNDGGVWGEDFDDDGIIVLRSTEQTIDGEWCIEEPARRLLSHSEYAASRLRCGDLVVTKSSGSALHIGKTTIVTQEVEELNCCYSNFMQRLRVKSHNLPRFLYYIINGPIGRAQFVYGSNTTTGLANLNGGVIGNVIIALPSVSEQQAIAEFLDRRTGAIDALIAKKELVIELLREKRTAIISHAVTKGLNPDAKMKDSRIDWLGEVPEHWEVKRLKRVSKRIQTGCTPPTAQEYYYEDGTISWYGPGNFGDDLILGEASKLINESAIKDGVARLFEAGSTMIVAIGATIGKVGYIDKPASSNQQITAVAPNIAKVLGKFLAYQLKRLEQVLKGIAPNTTLPIMDQQKIGCLMVVNPPISEQQVIVDFLDRETSRIDVLVAKVTEAIEKLKEYRTALISAAVTGKIDVREEGGKR